MSTPSTKSRRRTVLLTGFILFWLAVSLWTIHKVKPEFWKDGYSYFREAQQLSEKGDLNGALAAIDKALGRDAGNAGYLVFKGSIAEKAGRADDAAAAYSRALELTPGDPEAALGLAKLLLATGKDTEAGNVLVGLPADKLDKALLERRAGLQAQYGEQAGAIADYERLLATSPDDTGYLRALAASAMAVQDWPRAEKALSKLLSLAKDPDLTAWTREQLVVVLRAARKSGEAYALLASAPDSANAALRAALAMELGNFAQAKPLLEEVLNTDPGNVKAMNQLAIALRAMGDPAGAYALFTSIPDADNLRSRAELALELEKFAEAAALYAALAKQEPADVAIKERLAYALDRSGQARLTQASPAVVTGADTETVLPLPGDAAAEQEYRQALASGKASEETRIRFAWLLMRAKRYDEVLEVLGETVTTEARDDVLKLAAEAAFLAGKYDRAIPLLSALVKRQPDNASALQHLADAYDAVKKPEPAAKAMEKYVALVPNDRAARLKLAGLLARSGNMRQAEDLYRRLLETTPDNTQAMSELATLYESQHRFTAAIAVLSKGVESARQPDPELLYRLARLYGYAKNYPEAVRTYNRLLATSDLAPKLRATASLGLAEALLETGDAAAAQKRLAALNAWDSRDPTLLQLAARASMLGKDPANAVKALENLSARRPLKPVETEWLAGQYRLLGRKDKSLALYEKALAAGALTTSQGLEALGDLRFDMGKFQAALSAYQKAARAGGSAGLALKLARAADKAGNKALAKSSYEHFLATHPNNPELLLEMARFAVNTGNYAQALSLYDRVVAAKGSQGLSLELALANLAAQRFGAAAKWARQAMDTGKDGDKAVLALVQALHLEGKTAEADRLLREHRQEIMAHPEGRQWLGYVDVARNRQLQAFDIFTDLAKAKGPDEGKMWLWRGIAATRRGDYRRARESFEKAKQFGATVPDAATGQ